MQKLVGQGIRHKTTPKLSNTLSHRLVVKKEYLIFYHCILSGDKTLDGYQKKKYVCKLLFIFLLGHDIDFGHMEAVNLLSSNKYTEKQIVSTNPKRIRSMTMSCRQFAL